MVVRHPRQVGQRHFGLFPGQGDWARRNQSSGVGFRDRLDRSSADFDLVKTSGLEILLRSRPERRRDSRVVPRDRITPEPQNQGRSELRAASQIQTRTGPAF